MTAIVNNTSPESLLTRAKVLALLIVSLAVSGCDQAIENAPLTIGPFMGMEPTDTPKILAPDLLASPAEEYNGTFSPDGKEFYYTTDIPDRAIISYTSLQPDNTWSTLRVAPFSGAHPDYDPVFSPDGSRLYFSSRRPVAGTDLSKIWYVERVSDGWSDPQRLGVTGPEQDEFYNSSTASGTIYYNSWISGEIFRAVPADTAYRVEKLPAAVNSGGRGGDPFIGPDEDYLLFRSYRSDGLGRGDLYISFNLEGEWTEPENLGTPINSAMDEICPYVTPDGKFFIFASSRIEKELEIEPLEPIEKVRQKFGSIDNGEMNVYYMSADFIEQKRANYKTGQ